MAGDTTVTTVLVTDKSGKPQPLAPVEFTVNSKKVSWPGCITNALGKVVLTWPSDPMPAFCIYKIGEPRHTGQLALPPGSIHNVRIVLGDGRKESNIRERKFKLVEQKTVAVPRLPDMHAGLPPTVTIFESGGKGVDAARVHQALKVDEKSGQTDACFIEDDGKPFVIAATRWEQANCVPIGDTKFFPVVNGNGLLVAWYHPRVSPDYLYSVIPPLFYELFPDEFPRDDTEVPPPSVMVYDAKGSSSKGFYQLSKTSIGFFPGGSGGVKFGVLFDIHGKVLALQVSSNGTGGDGDPLWDKVCLVLSLGQLVKGLVIGVGKFCLKTLMRRFALDLVDDVADDLTLKFAKRVAKRLLEKSPWLRRIKQIRGIKEMEKQYDEIAKFIDDYKAGTGIQIDVLPSARPGKWRGRNALGNHQRPVAEDYGLGLGPHPNLGTYVEEEGKILMHEDVWTKTRMGEYEIDVMTELGHEVGAAEICRLMKRTKDQIPTVEKWFGLTHVLDEALK